MKVLILYFEPFSSDTVNSGAEAVKCLDTESISADIVTHQLPVSFSRCAKEASAKVEAEQPDLILCLGQAASRTTINLERVAINVANGKNSDNDGVKLVTKTIVSDAPDAYMTKIAIDDLSQFLREKGIPCFVSNSAGTYVCNTLYYSLLHQFPYIPILFVHVPITPVQASIRTSTTSSMSSEFVACSIVEIIRWLHIKYN